MTWFYFNNFMVFFRPRGVPGFMRKIREQIDLSLFVIEVEAVIEFWVSALAIT